MTVYAILSRMTLAIAIIFILGIGNFALQRAVFESEHPMIDQMRGFLALGGKPLLMTIEFAVLLGAMLLAANGWPAIAWAYGAYSAFNAVAAWLILDRRV